MTQLLKLNRGAMPACFDAVSIHPYQSGPPEHAIAEYSALRNVLRLGNKETASLPIVASEWGYSTCTHPCLTKDLEVAGTELEQAKYLVRSWLSSQLAGVELVVWYDFVNGHAAPTLPNGSHPLTANKSMLEDNFGTLHSDFSLKPSYTAAETVQQVVGAVGQPIQTMRLNTTNLRPCPLCGPVFALELISSKYGSRNGRTDSNSVVVIAVWTVGYRYSSDGQHAQQGPSAQVCKTPPSTRTTCGQRGIDSTKCTSLGCCWSSEKSAGVPTGWSTGEYPPCFTPWENHSVDVRFRSSTSDRTLISNGNRCYQAIGMLGQAMPNVCEDSEGWITLAASDAPLYLRSLKTDDGDTNPSKANAASCAEPLGDCTAELQRALRSPSRIGTVVISPLPGGRPWLVRPLVLAGPWASNLTIRLNAGVEILAFSNATYRWPRHAPLLTIVNGSNLTLSGEDTDHAGAMATLRMRKHEYTNRTLYPAYSEWRHLIAVQGCEDVRFYSNIAQDSV